MAPKPQRNLSVQGTAISTSRIGEEDYISLTDMVRGAEYGKHVIQNWLRNRNTLEFLGIWERLNNPQFKYLEFEGIMAKAGFNRFSITPQRWAETTNAHGLITRRGRYGGTYAQKDIAFEFAAWLSPEFKLLLIQEFQRLKQQELQQTAWDIPRYLSKVNYRIQTDAVKEVLLPQVRPREDTAWLVYAEEADLIKVVVFGVTAKEWRDAHPEEATAGENVRDSASILELTLVSNLEMLNAHLIRDGITKAERYQRLAASAAVQARSLGAGEPERLV